MNNTIYGLRVFALLVSFFNVRVSKSFIYLFAAARIVKFLFLPLEEEGTSAKSWAFLAFQITFLTFGFWQTVFVGCAILTSFSLSRLIYFDESFNMLRFIVVNLLFVVFSAFVNGLTNKIGFLFVELDVLRSGNDSLLNSLEEGVIIVEENCSEVCFLNSAA